MRQRFWMGPLVLLLSLGLAACEQTEEPSTSTPTEAAPLPPPTPVRTGRSVSTPAPRSAAAAGASASSGSNLVSAAQLRGDRVAEVNQTLTSRGYQRIRVQGGTTYWKNTQTNRCLRVASANGRVTQVSNTNASHCRR